MDGARAIHSDVLEGAPRIVEGEPGFIGRAILNCCRFLEVAAGARARLAPDLAIDLVRHAHQCTPCGYARLMASLPDFVDHELCVEENPPDPQWTENLLQEWVRLLGCQVDPELFPKPEWNFGKCCCAQSTGAVGVHVSEKEGQEQLLRAEEALLLSGVVEGAVGGFAMRADRV